MKKVLVAFVVILMAAAISGCKKENNGSAVYNPSSYSNKIVLSNLQTSSDSIVLRWSKLSNNRFYLYLVIRRDYKAADPSIFSNSDIIQEIYDPSVVKFVDHNVPLAPYLEYEIIGVLVDSITSNYSFIYSNIVTYQRSSIKTFYFNPTDVVPDIPNHRFYVIEADSGKISLVNYTNASIVKSIKTNSTNGFCDLGTYNGVRELYVPRNDGWVFIYDAETLDKIDQINAGTSCGSVIFNNGKLFIFGSSDYYYNDMYVIDRATKSVITTINSIDYMRPKMIPGSNTKLFGVSSSYSSSGDIYYFEFDANGNKIVQNYNYSSNPTDFHAFEVFPDGQHFITSSYGAIYASDLSYVLQLPYGDYEFSGFAFDATSSQVLAGCRNYKNIVAYAIPGYTELKTYSTLGYPAFIFNDNNTLISLSSTTSFSSYSYGRDFIIEKVPLSKQAFRP
ncbi:MAG: hypothetical protein NTW10_07520 [Bacteroidetes bacterium]|nr:hypothetical protein [Bacteroidota bacterium]